MLPLCIFIVENFITIEVADAKASSKENDELSTFCLAWNVQVDGRQWFVHSFTASYITGLVYCIMSSKKEILDISKSSLTCEKVTKYIFCYFLNRLLFLKLQ